MRNLHITIWIITALLATSTTAFADATDIHSFTDSQVSIDLIYPAGNSENIILTGSSQVYTYFEGPTLGDADDDNGNGLDEVPTEMVALSLTGTSAMVGTVTMSRNLTLRSLGEIEENTNTFPALLDLPPFTPTGTAASIFDLFFEINLTGIGNLYNQTPARITTTLTVHPPDPGTVYASTASIPLYDQNGNPTGYNIGQFLYEPIPVQYDFGDAPDDAAVPRYPTLAANNGANHATTSGLRLGAAIDSEPDGLPDNFATGDDIDATDDEDGVKFITWPLVPGRPAVVEVTASASAFLYAWIDFSADDSWAQANDQIFNAVALSPGTNTLIFNVPMTATPNTTTFSRFRLTTDTNLSFDGPASDGEVEDHTVKIKERCGIKWLQLPDETPNGIDISVISEPEFQRIVADDFQCTKYGLITDIHLWGAWLNDAEGSIQDILLSIYSDDPIGPGGSDPENTYSKPDIRLWQTDIRPGQFTTQVHTRIPTGQFWWDPAIGSLIPQAEREIQRIDMYIDPAKAFLQEGTPEEPVVYWLAVRVITSSGQFGWKTRRFPEHYNDDAVFAQGTAEPLSWQELTYPPTHPYDKSSIDMAFIVTTDDYCPARADLNCSGFVDIYDFTIFAAQWQQIAL